jgi:hypothetical protein
MSFLLNIFESDTKKHWQEFADEIGATFIDGGWNSDKVISKYRNTTIELDIFTTNGQHRKTYTRITCPYVTPKRFAFKFNIAPENILTYAGKLFGFKDIEIGNKTFDTLINLKSNQKALFLKFLDSMPLREMILEAFEGPQPDKILNTFRNTEFNLFIEDKGPYLFHQKTQHKILFIKILNLEIEEDIEMLKFWFKICQFTLDRLIEIGEAEDITPDYQ